jgi:uncharacterized membrane protein YagU involved in acid resistance
LSQWSSSQLIVEPRVAVILTLYAAVQRSILTETATRYQLIGVVVLVAGVELLVMPLLGRRPAIWSFAVNAILAAFGMILAKWAIESINWASAQRKLGRIIAGR